MFIPSAGQACQQGQVAVSHYSDAPEGAIPSSLPHLALASVFQRRKNKLSSIRSQNSRSNVNKWQMIHFEMVKKK